MKAITIWQPWASLIITGHKQFETRHWSNRHRGLVAIHAAKRWTSDQRLAVDHFNQFYPEVILDVLNMPLGCVLGICRLTGIYKSEDLRPKLSAKEKTFGDFSDGRYGWRMEVVEVFNVPIPVKGQQGLWEWERQNHV